MLVAIPKPRSRFVPALVGAVIILTSASLTHAELVTDPANDFLSTYIFPKNGDMDARSSEVTLNSSNNTLTFTATVNGAIGTTPNGAWVWGLDRG